MNKFILSVLIFKQSLIDQPVAVGVRAGRRACYMVGIPGCVIY